MTILKTSKSATTPLREQMIADMTARNLNPHTQRSHVHSCKRFAAFLGRSPDTATADEVKAFQLHLIESGASIQNRNRIMTGVKFLLKPVLIFARSRLCLGTTSWRRRRVTRALQPV